MCSALETESRVNDDSSRTLRVESREIAFAGTVGHVVLRRGKIWDIVLLRHQERVVGVVLSFASAQKRAHGELLPPGRVRF